MGIKIFYKWDKKWRYLIMGVWRVYYLHLSDHWLQMKLGHLLSCKGVIYSSVRCNWFVCWFTFSCCCNFKTGYLITLPNQYIVSVSAACGPCLNGECWVGSGRWPNIIRNMCHAICSNSGRTISTGQSGENFTVGKLQENRNFAWSKQRWGILLSYLLPDSLVQAGG